MSNVSMVDGHIDREVRSVAYYWFTFEDGYRVCVRGFSKQELAVEESKHGKLVSKVKE